ncbi:hypothetical protein CR513_23656, partial [Mucuna pruriens]
MELFQVLERINDNAYKLDLSTGERFDSRTNPFEEGGNDRNPTDKDKDNLRDTRGRMTRSKTKNVAVRVILSLDNFGFTGRSQLGSSSSSPIFKTLSRLGSSSSFTYFQD